jgi:hypothetical protein
MNGRGFARALGASLSWGIGVGEQQRLATEADATAEAQRLAQMRGCPAYVYRSPSGRVFATTNEPEIEPGFELVLRVTSLKRTRAAPAQPHPLLKGRGA